MLGLPSAGLHTNGYSLARKLLLEKSGYNTETRLPGLKKPIGETLLAPHLNYLPVLKPLVDRKWIKGMAHITGGGLTENIPRILPVGCAAIVRVGSGPVSRSSAFFRKWAELTNWKCCARLTWALAWLSSFLHVA